MTLPILKNSRECIHGLHEGEDVTPDVQRIDLNVDVTDGHLRALEVQLRDLQRKVDRRGANAQEFDNDAPQLLHHVLRLNGRAGAEQDFWAYLSVRMEDIVRWRWGSGDSHAPSNRYEGGWKNTFRRLWYRAELTYAIDPDDPYKYARLGGEDFWVGLLERELSGCRVLVGELLPYWFGEPDGADRSMEEHRRFFTALVLLRPSRAFEALDRRSLRRLFTRAEELAELDWVGKAAS